MSRILIADDNVDFALTCTNFLTKEKNIEIVDVVADGISAFNSYIKYQPDILILDLDLPCMNGIDVINKLSEDKNEKKKSNIIVVSGAFEKLIPYNTTKVYKMFQKPIKHDELIKTIYEMQEIIDIEQLENKIDDLFYNLRLHVLSSKGVTYLKQAVIYCFNDETLFYNISKVYSMVATDNTIYNVKPKNVLWSLESLINTYEKSVDNRFLSSFFIYYDETRNLTPKYFIELIVIYLKRNIK